MPPQPFVIREDTKIPSAAALKGRFAALSKEPGIKALSTKLVEEGFKPVVTGKNAFFGVTETFKSNKGETATVTIEVQSYQKTGSKDAAAVGNVRVKSGKNEATYRFSLVAPKGDFEKAEEHTVDRGNKVKKANSWYTRWRSCLRSRCAAACLGALVTCGGTWAAYFWCVVARCGGCVLRCAGCASCDCRWWCRWAVGCCD